MRSRASSGLTLVELLVTCAILAILLAVAAPSLNDFLNRRRVENVANVIASDLMYARAETNLRVASVIVFFQKTADQSCYSIVQTYLIGPFCECSLGAGAACDPAVNTDIEMRTFQAMHSKGVEFESFSPAPPIGANRIAFTRPLGTPMVPGFFVVVSGARGAKLRIDLSAVGRVRICSPNASMPGYASC